ncbi:MAG: bifunctional phosphopantothenoylcysteine decarboxylase/phosphopantothenate--cysteine ligase CoaBC [Nitrospirae bacterium]|nr:bifunctional phosphopantothenoylcysteine decarboxylase/phosphopantothenate--cysteine ligase CoaBC [Nitrospirota bacterium]
METALRDKHILLGVTGSIAAYKSVLILRELIQAGARVTVVMTSSARQFITPLTFQVLSRRPVYTSLFDPSDEIRHLTLAERADLILIAPATANIIGKIANGIADDLLTTLVLAGRAPLVIAPAMDGDMWTHPVLQRNLSVLDGLGVRVVPPEEGPLASGKEGMGRLASEEKILSAVQNRLKRNEDFKGETVLMTAGPTQEPVDPVRYLTNRSSGKMGYALARAAQGRGARVLLISGPTSLPCPVGVERVQVRTAEEMRDAVLRSLPEATVLIMAAAVADYRPRRSADRKLKKGLEPVLLELEPTPDILSEVRLQRGRRFHVGFAAETEDLENRARAKLEQKGLDLIVANDVTQEGAGFDLDTNIVTLMDAYGETTALPKLSKAETAERILDAIVKLKTRPRTNDRIIR